jgi:hypothetical protein
LPGNVRTFSNKIPGSSIWFFRPDCPDRPGRIPAGFQAKSFEGLMKKTVFCSKKPWKNPFFFNFLDFQAPGAISPPEFQKLVEQKLFAIIKGNFSALSVRRIRETPKNDPPYWSPPTCLKKCACFFWAYFIRIAKRNNFVEEFFSIRALFLRENSIWKFKTIGTTGTF